MSKIRRYFGLSVLVVGCSVFFAQHSYAVLPAHWRPATDKELAEVIPDRAPVIAERIETELRTASGITDGRGHTIAGVVLITAGYSANGKYSDFLLTQVPLKIGDTLLPEGHYLIGWTRGENDLDVTISEASTGKVVTEVKAPRNEAIRGVQAIHIWPPTEHSVIQLGRFTIPYTIATP